MAVSGGRGTILRCTISGMNAAIAAITAAVIFPFALEAKSLNKLSNVVPQYSIFPLIAIKTYLSTPITLYLYFSLSVAALRGLVVFYIIHISQGLRLWATGFHLLRRLFKNAFFIFNPHRGCHIVASCVSVGMIIH
ncbi:MAG: hypothetical protein A2X45_06395 [Lentisphaerae bacterium GWF2_50_93]|nr:MAG: hypothetical protein A2X45_06395 [Lentisphaerae bacterium GWF2_50_93]